MSSQRRYFLALPLFLGTCAVVGGLFGPGAGRVSAAQQHTLTAPSDEDLKAGLDSFTKVYDVVEENYADKLSADKAIYKGAIPGMLRTLDPHSNFFDPKDFAGLREEQHGKYYGVGMTDRAAAAYRQDDGYPSVWRFAGVQSWHPARRSAD